MVSAGLFLKSDIIRVVTITGSRDQHKQIAMRVNKLEIGADPDKGPSRRDALKLLSY